MSPIGENSTCAAKLGEKFSPAADAESTIAVIRLRSLSFERLSGNRGVSFEPCILQQPRPQQRASRVPQQQTFVDFSPRTISALPKAGSASCGQSAATNRLAMSSPTNKRDEATVANMTMILYDRLRRSLVDFAGSIRFRGKASQRSSTDVTFHIFQVSVPGVAAHAAADSPAITASYAQSSSTRYCFRQLRAQRRATVFCDRSRYLHGGFAASRFVGRSAQVTGIWLA